MWLLITAYSLRRLWFCHGATYTVAIWSAAFAGRQGRVGVGDCGAGGSAVVLPVGPQWRMRWGQVRAR